MGWKLWSKRNIKIYLWYQDKLTWHQVHNKIYLRDKKRNLHDISPLKWHFKQAIKDCCFFYTSMIHKYLSIEYCWFCHYSGICFRISSASLRLFKRCVKSGKTAMASSARMMLVRDRINWHAGSETVSHLVPCMLPICVCQLA